MSEQVLVVEEDDRYSRLRLIPWWDQDRLAQARVMVVGAGALGNEILKNLALLGIGQIVIVDFDTIENSNLSRSVLYRSGDEGLSKVDVAGRAVREINPDCRYKCINGDLSYDVGLGLIRRMDVVLGGLDNRETRVAINQACWKVGTPWVDGAIEAFFGVARVFIPPDTPCYECTLTESDYKILNMRRSCALLSRDEMIQGKVPTTPTTSSIIAGIQVQEAVKLIHNRPDLPVLAGKGYFFNGLTHDSYTVTYQRKKDCPGHDTFNEITEIDHGASTITAGEMLELVRADLGPEAVLELEREIVISLRCQRCHQEERVFKALGQVSEREALCPQCRELRIPEMTHVIKGNEDFLDMSLDKLGVPPLDIVTGRSGLKRKHYELCRDLESMGDLSDGA